MDIPQFVCHSLVEGHLGSFQFRAIVHRATVNIYIKVCVDLFPGFLGKVESYSKCVFPLKISCSHFPEFQRHFAFPSEVYKVCPEKAQPLLI